MCPAIVSGSDTGDTPVRYWPILSPVPEVFAKVSSVQFPFKVAIDEDHYENRIFPVLSGAHANQSQFGGKM